jgi:tetratricopeptide (TPR) repeat protein
MTEDKKEYIKSIDPSVVKTVEELQEYAKNNPGALSVKAAIEGILDHLIQESLRSGTVEDDINLTIRLLEELTGLFPDNHTPLLNLAKIFIEKKDYDTALKYAEAGLQIKLDSLDLLFDYSLALLQTGKEEAGIDGFKRYIELDPDNPWAYNNIGDAYRKLKIYDKAEDYFKLAIEKDNNFPSAYYNLAMLYLDQKDWTRCVHYGQIAEKNNPSDKDIHLVLGDAFLGLREYRSALNHLVIATLFDRNFVEAYESMSCAYADLGMYELSLAAAQEALKLEPNSWMALANIGYCYTKQGKFGDAIIYDEEALQHAPDQEKKRKLCWDLGWNYFQIDRYPEALEYTEQAIKLKESPEIVLFFNKGLILLAQGKEDEANFIYEQAIEKATDLENFQAILEAKGDIRDFITKKGIEIDEASSWFKLLNGDFDINLKNAAVQ